MNLNKSKFSSLVHGIECKNDLAKKKLDNALIEEKLKHVIVGDLEAHLLLWEGGLKLQSQHNHVLK